MAQIIKKESALEKEYRARTGRSRWKLVAAILFAAVTVVGIVTMIPVLPIVGLVGTGLFLTLTVMDSNQNNTLGTGIAGETATAELIRQLPDGFWGFQNPVVVYQGKESEMDMVVVGPTGVFIIETKNHNGTIQGHYEQPQWVQHKVGRGGGAYSKEFYSPVKQVGTHVYRLAHFLRERGCNVHVDGMVFFTNPGAQVQVFGTQGRIPVYAGQPGATMLCRQIMAGRQALPAQTVTQICRILEKQI